MLPLSPSVYMCFDHVDLKDLISLMSSTLHSSFILFHGVPWTLRGKGFDINISFRDEYYKVSLSLHNVRLWVSVFISICYRRKLSDNGWALTYDYSRMSLRVISLQIFFLLKNSSISFHSRSWCCLVSDSCFRHGFHLVAWP